MWNHHQITCLLHQKFLDCIDLHSFILVCQLFGFPSHTHFCVTLSGKNALNCHVGNFDTVFVYQQIPNFTNCEPLVMFENCEHCTSRFINWSFARSNISFIVLNVFHFSLWNLCTHKWTMHSGIMFTPYTFCSCLCMVNVERFSAVRKCITVCNSHSPDTYLRGSSMFNSQ